MESPSKIIKPVFDTDEINKAERAMTNTEFVTSVMEFSMYGSLTQSFVIEALRKYSENITLMGRPTEEDGGLISKRMWHDIAVEVSGRIEAKYGYEKAAAEQAAKEGKVQ
jgi:hypothetical protein